ncbi:MAG: N-acetylmuramoyl-L-alanine amidase [Syntrophaceae bacterium]|nr:N-acetylmuramoyl-L-alanine amidase [Syntrophaceae bacterium]
MKRRLKTQRAEVAEWKFSKLPRIQWDNGSKMKVWSLRVFLSLLVLAMCALSDAVAQPPQRAHVVIIDPAHGGDDSGVKVSDKEYEKDITLAIALSLKKELEKIGNIRVQLTRSSDKLVPFSERRKTAASARGELFVSIHVNAGFGKTSSGYEVYFPGVRDAQAEQSNSKEILKDMARNKSLNDSIRLAQLIQKNMDGVFPRKSRGIRDASVPVLEGLSIPAVLVEIGFATNPEDRKKMTDGSTQNSVARALYQSIKDFY